MRESIVVVAPHPDDETLGCGGTLLRRAREGAALHWVIVTDMPRKDYSAARRKSRDAEIKAVARRYGFASTRRLGFPAAGLDRVAFSNVARAIGQAVAAAKPATLLLPHRGDAHTDHRIAADAAASCGKWFRFPTVKRVLAYETLSETDFGLLEEPFRPDVFTGIARELPGKLDILKLYAGETAPHPFPRSAGAIEALATVRGAAVGLKAAEAFMLVKETR